MIECRPCGICSWDFTLEGDGHRAWVTFKWIGEQGRVVVDGEEFRVAKDGIFSGRWRLESTQGTVFTAEKPSAFLRTFKIYGSHESATLQAVTAFSRTMTLEGGGSHFTITPAHAFTRRARIEGEVGDFRLTAFAFWLTVLTWRRRASNNNGGGGGGT